MSLLLLRLPPFLGGVIAIGARNIELIWAALVTLAVAMPLALLDPEVRDGGVVIERLVWLPGLAPAKKDTI